MQRRARFWAVGAFVGTMATAPLLRADCEASAHLTSCIEPDNLWPHAGSSEFTFLGATRTTAAGRLGFGVVTTYLARPVVLVLPTANTRGAEVAAVDRLWNTTALFSFGLTRRIELDLAFPFTTFRTGTGISAITSQSTSKLSSVARRDLRLGATFALWPSTAGSSAFELASRFEITVPAIEAFAGDRSWVGVPSFSGSWRSGMFVAGAELGARLRRPVELSGSRFGSQLVAGLGVGANGLDGKVGLRLEAIALPTFEAQHDLALNSSGHRIAAQSRPPLVPIEWLASVRTGGLLDSDLSMSLGAGGALPVTGDAAMTTPSVRVVLSVRYAPSE